MRYGEIFHEPKVSEMYCNISRETSVISDFTLVVTGNEYAQ